MSDIVDRLRNPKRALWYCREFSRGDDESLDIQEAADEIERLRGLLHDWREQWGDGMHPDGDLIDATDAALAGAAVQPNGATETLRHIAAIAHDGGLYSTEEWALWAIRRLTLPHWDRTGDDSTRRVRVDHAHAAANATPFPTSEVQK